MNLEEVIGRGRFDHDMYSEEYDLKYAVLKREFDRMDVNNRKSAKKLKDLAIDSQNLTRKYLSIGDEEGAKKSSLLHEQVEDAAARLVPIYESWNRKKITVGLVLFALFAGFWKGDYIKKQIAEPFSKRGESVYNNPSLPKNNLELNNYTDLRPKNGVVPHALALGTAEHPNAIYGVIVSKFKHTAEMYDLRTNDKLMSFPVTTGGFNTNNGIYEVDEFGIQNGSGPIYGSVFFVLEPKKGSEIVFSGTYSEKYLQALQNDTNSTVGDIATYDSTIINLYKKVKTNEKNMIVVIKD